MDLILIFNPRKVFCRRTFTMRKFVVLAAECRQNSLSITEGFSQLLNYPCGNPKGVDPLERVECMSDRSVN